MPHVDLQQTQDSTRLDCDLCIIGTGPAGATIARELSGTGIRITLLESGGFKRQPEVDALNTVESIGRPRVADQWLVRNRIVGGSSHTWTGRCAPFDAIDFERRDWIPLSGWPFDLAHLEPWLDRSAPYLGLSFGTGFNDERFWELSGRRPRTPAARKQGSSPDDLLPFFWQSSRDEAIRRDFMRFGRHMVRHLGANVTLVTNATVLQIHTDEAGSAVSSVEVADRSGKTHHIRSSAVALCAGGIENARLLLASDDRIPGGLGNGNDLVGRFLMDHPRDTVGVFPHRSRRLQKHFGSYRLRSSAGENLFRRGFRLSPRIQQAEGLVNCSAFLREVIAPDDPWAAVVRILNRKGRRRSELATIASRPAHLVRALHNHFLSRRPMPHKVASLELVCMCEQIPDPNSRVTLLPARDPLGTRVAQIDWRSHPVEATTIRRMAHLVSSHFAALGQEVPTLRPWVDSEDPDLPSSFRDAAHPTGTTRMADNPGQGVVDRDCRVHGIRGLYVAGSSTFPTSGHCNPTQMIVAMAIRLADTLRFRLARPLSPIVDLHHGGAASKTPTNTKGSRLIA